METTTSRRPLAASRSRISKRFSRSRRSELESRQRKAFFVDFFFGFSVFYAIQSTQQLEHHLEHSTDSAASELSADAAASKRRLLQAQQHDAEACCFAEPTASDGARAPAQVLAADEHDAEPADCPGDVIQPTDVAEAVGADDPVDGSVAAAVHSATDGTTWQPEQGSRSKLLRQSAVESGRAATAAA